MRSKTLSKLIMAAAVAAAFVCPIAADAMPIGQPGVAGTIVENDFGTPRVEAAQYYYRRYYRPRYRYYRPYYRPYRPYYRPYYRPLLFPFL